MAGCDEGEKVTTTLSGPVRVKALKTGHWSFGEFPDFSHCCALRIYAPTGKLDGDGVAGAFARLATDSRGEGDNDVDSVLTVAQGMLTDDERAPMLERLCPRLTDPSTPSIRAKSYPKEIGVDGGDMGLGAAIAASCINKLRYIVAGVNS